MTFPEWLNSTEGQDAVSDVFFGDKVQMTRALERAFLAGRKVPLVDPEPPEEWGARE